VPKRVLKERQKECKQGFVLIDLEGVSLNFLIEPAGPEIKTKTNTCKDKMSV
jgi:hypothetical protein